MLPEGERKAYYTVAMYNAVFGIEIKKVVILNFTWCATHELEVDPNALRADFDKLEIIG